MNEQLQAKLVEILVSIQSATKAAGDFAMEQLPDIAQQYVLYGRASICMWLAFWFAVATCSAFLMKKFVANEFAAVKAKSSTGGWAAACLPVGIVGAISAVCLAMCAQSALMVFFAPKVWLLKEIAGLVR